MPIVDLSETDLALPVAVATGAALDERRFPSEALAAIEVLSWTDEEASALGEAWRPIRTLVGLAHCPRLRELELGGNHVRDLAPVRDCPALVRIGLRENPVRDLSALAALADLQHLDLHATRVHDLQPLEELPLRRLDLGGAAEVVDLGPLGEIETLEELWVDATVDLGPLSLLDRLRVVYVASFGRWHDRAPRLLAALRERGVRVHTSDPKLEARIHAEGPRPEGTPSHDRIARALLDAGQADLARMWLSLGPTARPEGATPLHLLVGRIGAGPARVEDGTAAALIPEMVAAGVDPNARDAHRRTALGAVSPRVAPLTFAALLRVCDPDRPRVDPPLAAAVGARDPGREARVRALLDAGADLCNPVVLATLARRGHLDLLRDALDAGADPDGQLAGNAPLLAATAADRLDAMRLLLDHGADPNLWVWGIAEQRIVHEVASVDALELLLAHGCDPHARDGSGRTLLHRIGERSFGSSIGTEWDPTRASRQAVALARRLLALGLDPCAVGARSVLAEVCAARTDHPACKDALVEIVDLLIAAGADPLLPTWAGRPQGAPAGVHERLDAFGVTSVDQHADVLLDRVGDIATIAPGTRAWDSLAALLESRRDRERLAPRAPELRRRVADLLDLRSDPVSRLLRARLPDAYEGLLPAVAWLSGGRTPRGATLFELADHGLLQDLVAAGLDPHVRGQRGRTGHHVVVERFGDAGLLRALGPPPDDRAMPSVSLVRCVAEAVEGRRDPRPAVRARAEAERQALEAWLEETWSLLTPIRLEDVLPFDRADLVHRVLDTGAPVDGVGRATPLEVAVARDYVHAVAALLDRGADPDGREDLPLALACSARAVELLLAAGADVHGRRADGTPLVLAPLRPRHGPVRVSPPEAVAMCRKMVAAGADPWATDKQGRDLASVLARLDPPEAAQLRASLPPRPRR